MTPRDLNASAALLDGIRAFIEPAHVRTDADSRLHYGRDWTRLHTPNPLAVVLPGGIDQVQQLVGYANEHRLALVPSGGRTGLSGAAVACHGEIVVSLERMNRILDFDPTDRSVTCEAGVVTEVLQNFAHDRGLYYPVDFASRGSSQIGGNIATNAGGIRVVRYGNTREWVAGVKLVTGSGELMTLGRGLVKDSSGYDLRHLAIASEGTLGIIVEATLKLTDPPPPSNVMLLALPSFEALMQVFAAFRARLQLQAFEFLTDVALKHVLAHGEPPPFEQAHPYYVVTEFASDEASEAEALAAFEQCLEQGLVSDGVISASDAQAAQLWRLREAITESLARYVPYKNDVSVRISAMPAFLAETQVLLGREYPQLEVVWFGHIGDGNLHINILKPDAMAQDAFVADCERVTKLLAQSLQAHGGSISAEHGIGLVKKPYLACTRSAAEIAAMRGIKAVLDPNGIMNPGKLFDR